MQIIESKNCSFVTTVRIEINLPTSITYLLLLLHEIVFLISTTFEFNIKNLFEFTGFTKDVTIPMNTL